MSKEIEQQLTALKTLHQRMLAEFAKVGYHCEPLDQTHILALKK